MDQESNYDYNYQQLILSNQSFWKNNSGAFLESNSSFNPSSWNSQEWSDYNFESINESQNLSESSSDYRYKPYPKQEHFLAAESLSQSTKNAAKLRRERENIEFRQLSFYLPLPRAISSQLDKASIVKLVNSFFELKFLMASGDSGSEAIQERDADLGFIGETFDSAFHLALNGFVLVVNSDLKVLFISDAASNHLGISQVDMIGSNLREFVHADDLMEIMQQFCPQNVTEVIRNSYDFSSRNVLETTSSYSSQPLFQQQPESGDFQNYTRELERNQRTPESLIIRFKCLLAKRNAGLAVNGYKAILCSSSVKDDVTNMSKYNSVSVTGGGMGVNGGRKCLQIVAEPIPSVKGAEMRLFSNMYIFRVGLDLEIHFVDQRFVKSFNVTDLSGRSFYDVVHPLDLPEVTKQHCNLMRKGNMRTGPYRLLLEGEGGSKCLWVSTEATRVLTRSSSQSHSRPPSVVLTHTVIGDYFDDYVGQESTQHSNTSLNI